MAQDIPQRKHEDQQPGRHGAGRDAVEQIGDAAAQTARRTFAEAQNAERTVERTARDMAGAGVGTANQMMQDVSNRFANVFSLSSPEAQKAVRRTSQNLSAVMDASSKLSEASQGIWREWLDYTRQAPRQHWDGLQKIAAARSPHDLIDAQFALLREGMRTFLDSAVRISAISAKAVHAAADQVREDDQDSDGPAEPPQRRRA